jgi:pentapeptide repeat protein
MTLLLRHFVSSCYLQFANSVAILFHMTLLKAETSFIYNEYARILQRTKITPGRDPMANQAHLDRIREDEDVWNDWREQHPEAHPDLSNADLYDIAALDTVDLSGTDLSGADLSGIYLRWANLSRANLRGANLDEVILQGTRLDQAVLTKKPGWYTPK